MFSSGKDSIATLDLCCKYIKKVIAVHLYFVKGLSFRENILKYYSNRYKIPVHQYPQTDVSRIFSNQAFVNTTKDVSKIKQFDIELFIRKKHNISFLAYGYRKNESLQRRGQLSKCDGLEKKFKRFFPIADWTHKDVLHYMKCEKLPLSVEYSYGFRDINFFEGKGLIWLYRNYPDDYERVKQVYPFIDAELMRAQGEI